MSPDTKLVEIFRILPAQEKALQKLGIKTVKDLLYHFPTRYGDAAQVTNIADLRKGDTSVVFGQISGLQIKKTFRRFPMARPPSLRSGVSGRAEGVIEDNTGKIKIVWFHQAYLAKMIMEGSNVRVEGKVAERRGQLYFSNPKIESAPDLFTQTKAHSLYPIYPETRGLTSNWIYHKVQNIFASGILNEIKDLVPELILRTYKLPNLKTCRLFCLSSWMKKISSKAKRLRAACACSSFLGV